MIFSKTIYIQFINEIPFQNLIEPFNDDDSSQNLDANNPVQGKQ
jgi:hypothetical protein